MWLYNVLSLRMTLSFHFWQFVWLGFFLVFFYIILFLIFFHLFSSSSSVFLYPFRQEIGSMSYGGHTDKEVLLKSSSSSSSSDSFFLSLLLSSRTHKTCISVFSVFFLFISVFLSSSLSFLSFSLSFVSVCLLFFYFLRSRETCKSKSALNNEH